MSALPLIAVVIVNYNGYELTRDCLRSFDGVTYGNYALIVVDNASADGSVERLRTEFPRVHYLEHGKNAGFTGGNNLGIRKASEIGAEYVFLLNNDTVVSANVLDELLGFMEKNPGTGIVGPLTYYFEAQQTVSFGGGEIERNTGRYRQLHKGKTLNDLDQEVIDCSFIEGAAMFLRTDLALAVEGFSNVYFLTSEESELCVRVADKGLRLAVITSCSVWHKISQSLKGGSTLRDYYVFRNKLLFVRRNARGFGLSDLATLAAFYLRCFASSLRCDPDLATAKGIVLGVYDFLRGVTGPGRYAEKLNASCEGASLGAADMLARDTILVTPPSALLKRDKHLEMLYRILSGHGFRVRPFTLATALKLGRRAIWHIHWIDLFHTGQIRSLPMKRHYLFISLTRFLLFLCQLLLCKLARVRILWTIHNVASHDRPNSFFEKLVTRLLLVFADRVSAVNGYIREEIADRYGFGDIALLRQGLYQGCYPNRATRAEARQKLGLHADDFVLVFMGVVEEYKGIDVAMEAMDELRAEPVKLVVAGRLDQGSPYGRRVRELAQRNRNILLFDRFIPDDEVQFFFKAADYSIYPYRRIDNSGPLYLTLAFGVPAIIRGAGGIPEVLRLNPKVAIRIGAPESGAIAQAIRKARGTKVGESEFSVFHEELGWDALEGEILQLFFSLQDGPGRRLNLSGERRDA